MKIVPNPHSQRNDVEIVQHAIRKVLKKGNEWCVVSKDETQSFGCYPTKKQAEERLKQVEFFKNQ